MDGFEWNLDGLEWNEDIMQNNPLYFDKNACIREGFMKIGLALVVGGLSCYAFNRALTKCETFSGNVETPVGRGSFEFKTRT
jgi:hypothetical protein